MERWFDARFHGRDPPLVTESEKGCLVRAMRRLAQNTPSLTEVLGQMITAINPTVAQLWSELRKLGSLVGILRMLSEDFKTSLLGDYACIGRRPAPS